MSTASPSSPRPPRGLSNAGTALWSRLTAAPAEGECLIFSAAELTVLEMACRQADDIAKLEALIEADGLIVAGSKGQPKLSAVPSELRLQRAALARLVSQLAIPDDAEAEGRTPAQQRAQRAAQARWDRPSARRQERKHG